jgi:hypothetical protein
MRTLRVLAAIAVIGTGSAAKAQVYYGTLTYQLAFPIGETHQFISDISWRGIGLDLQYMVLPDVSVGFAFAWNVFYESTNQVIHFSNGLDVSGFQDRSLNIFPLLFDARYYPRLSTGKVQGFVGLGVGVYAIVQRLGIGLSTYETTEWHFGLAPELGILVPISQGAQGTISLRYNLPFGTSNQGFYQFLGLHIGIGWGDAPSI